MTFPDIESLYDQAESGETYEEQRYVPVASPYQFILQRTPQVSSVVSNLWVDVSTAAGYVSAWVWNAGWDVLTLVDAAPTTATQFAMQCRNTHYVNSARLDFHSSLAGALIKVSYDCYASSMDSNMFNTLQEHVARLESFIHLAPFSANTYSGGRFDASVADDMTVYLSPSNFVFSVPPAKGSYAGGTLDFSTGDLEITFALADGYKNVSVYMISEYNAVDEIHEFALAISQGAEQASTVDLPEAAEIAGLHLFTIQARVISSVIQSITQAMITETLTIGTKPGRFCLSFLYDGDLLVDEPLDRANGPGFACSLVGVSILGEVLGSSSATIINIVQYDTDDQVGTDLFDVDGDKPTLAYDDTEYVPQACDMTQANQDMLEVTATQSFQPFIQQVAGGTVSHVRVNMYFEY